MDWDPSLAFTAVMEMRPGLHPTRASMLTAALGSAMTEADPPDRWAFAREYLDRECPQVPEGALPRRWTITPGSLTECQRCGEAIVLVHSGKDTGVYYTISHPHEWKCQATEERPVQSHEPKRYATGEVAPSIWTPQPTPNHPADEPPASAG
jgi:hypothetical protein